MPAVYLKEHYVYAYYDEQGQPYYIGKGKGNRCFVKHHNIEVPSNEKIKKLYENLTNLIACDIEENLILKFGRKDLGTGILLNRKTRSEPYFHSKEVKEKLKKIMKGLSKKRSLETRKKQSETLKKIWQDPERRKKRSEISQELWKTFEYKKKMEDPLYRKKLSEISKKLWQDPEYRKKQLKINKERWNPERKKKYSEKMKTKWAEKKLLGPISRPKY